MTDMSKDIVEVIADSLDENVSLRFLSEQMAKRVLETLAAANLEVVDGWQWIDVDKLVDGQSYIVTHKDYFPKAEVARFRKGNNADNEDLFICGIMTRFYSCDTFTHWRPLPTPPTD